LEIPSPLIHSSGYFNAYADKPGHDGVATIVPSARYLNAYADKPGHGEQSYAPHWFGPLV
jgi:hypothetical protein